MENGEGRPSLVGWRGRVREACLSDRESGAREGGPEPAKECEARAPGKSQGRKGGGQRKRDLATAPSSLTRKQPLRQALTPHENLCQAKVGEGHCRQQQDGS